MSIVLLSGFIFLPSEEAIYYLTILGKCEKTTTSKMTKSTVNMTNLSFVLFSYQKSHIFTFLLFIAVAAQDVFVRQDCCSSQMCVFKCNNIWNIQYDFGSMSLEKCVRLKLGSSHTGLQTQRLVLFFLIFLILILLICFLFFFFCLFVFCALGAVV